MESRQLVFIVVCGVAILAMIAYCIYRVRYSLSSDMGQEFIYKVGPLFDEIGVRAYNMRNCRENNISVITSQLDAMEIAVLKMQDVNLKGFYSIFEKRLQNEKPRRVSCLFCRLELHCKNNKDACPIRGNGYCSFETAFKEQMRLDSYCDSTLRNISFLRKCKTNPQLFNHYLMVVEHDTESVFESLKSEHCWRIIHSVVYNDYQLTQAR